MLYFGMMRLESSEEQDASSDSSLERPIATEPTCEWGDVTFPSQICSIPRGSLSILGLYALCLS